MTENNYTHDLAEIRSMMERSSKFLSLSGWAGVMAGIYALTGAYIAYQLLAFDPGEAAAEQISSDLSPVLIKVIVLALSILILSIGTGIYLSSKNANKRNEKLWNPIARQLVIHLTIPLVAGGLVMVMLISKGLIELLAPFSLLFYGMALFNAGKFTYSEVKSLGLIEIALGLFSAWYVEYGLLFWALGFGAAHIIYGMYMHFSYER